MSDDDDTTQAAATAIPEAGSGWSEQDRRTLIITIVGGLAANVGTVILVGAAIAFVRVSKDHAGQVLGTTVLLALASAAIAIGHAGRHLRRPREKVPPRLAWTVLRMGGLAMTMAALILTGLAAGVK
jgi:hypothetical protein